MKQKQHDAHVREFYLRSVGDVYLDDGLRGWIAVTARKEKWRVADWYTLGDLIQDGLLCYYKCRDKYALRPPEPGQKPLNTPTPTRDQRKHFMALVKTAFLNHITTLSNRYAIGREAPLSESDEDRADLEQVLPPEPEVASIILALQQAPAEIRDAVEKILKDGLDGGEFLRTRLFQSGNRVRRGRSVIRETTREYWQRVLGDAELPEKIVAYLQA